MGVSGYQLIIGLAIGIVLLILMIVKTRIHTFFALIISSVVTAALCGVPMDKIVSMVTTGFGNTLASIGIVVGLGILIGEVFEMSGAGEKMANTFIKIFGEGREEWALAITGFIISIPVFSDTAMLILFPIAKALSRKTKKSIVLLGMCLMYSAVITHTLVPPTPGPLAAAEQFGVPLGNMILWGVIVSIPIMIAIVFYYKYMGAKIYILPEEEDENVIKDEKELPSTIASFTPILLPVLLIVMNTVLTATGIENYVVEILKFAGTPVIALSISLLISLLLLTKGMTRKEVLSRMDNGIKNAGIILLVTGGGGALGYILKESGAGNYLGQTIANTNIPPLLIPFLIASVVRVVQGSITVSIITAASISAPILLNIPGVNMTFAAISCCVGALSLSYFNDSGFWVQSNLMKLRNTKEQLLACSLQSPIAWITGFIMLMLLNALFGGIA
ncbi:gluconate:H+ symporter [Mahella sp.]|uniref:GntP family permease n=1 Tax=Mahella sp. TaxID=2798721 RepID=UPI0025C5A8D7|nr:gluconate:H+ symporter [Mahella sp.]MBZ4665635.1 gluconate transporter [Mahella sp.]